MKGVRGFLHCWLWRPAARPKGKSDCSAFQHQRTDRRAHRACAANWVRPVQRKTIVETSAQYATRKALILLARTFLEGLSSDGWTLYKEFPQTLVHAFHVSTTTRLANDLLDEAPLKGLCKVEASPRSHFVAEMLLSSYLTEAVAVSFVSFYLRANRLDLRHPVKKPRMKSLGRPTER